MIQSTLITTNLALEFVNDLATSYDCDPDGMKWTFHIRDDVKFSDGEVVSIPESTETFDRLIAGMIRFFGTGEVQVDKNETITIAEILEAAHKAEEVPGTWVVIA